MAMLCLTCSVFGLVMVPNKKRITETEEKKDQNIEVKKEKSGLRLLCDIPFLLMTIGNIPFAMAIYISYTYLPSVRIVHYLTVPNMVFLFLDGCSSWPVFL